MPSLALYKPEIPPNTGNIARLCAATQTDLHVVGQPAFHLDDRAAKRAGLDYWPHVKLKRHPDLDELRAALSPECRILFFSARRDFASCFDWQFRDDDCLCFGPESCGFAKEFLETNKEFVLRIPMISESVRSLNLANAAAIALYEALRQLNRLPL